MTSTQRNFDPCQRTLKVSLFYQYHAAPTRATRAVSHPPPPTKKIRRNITSEILARAGAVLEDAQKIGGLFPMAVAVSCASAA